eukprot:5657025-Pyramimonas_sp.AAC.1
MLGGMILANCAFDGAFPARFAAPGAVFHRAGWHLHPSGRDPARPAPPRTALRGPIGSSTEGLS